MVQLFFRKVVQLFFEKVVPSGALGFISAWGFAAAGAGLGPPLGWRGGVSLVSVFSPSEPRSVFSVTSGCAEFDVDKVKKIYIYLNRIFRIFSRKKSYFHSL